MDKKKRLLGPDSDVRIIGTVERLYGSMPKLSAQIELIAGEMASLKER